MRERFDSSDDDDDDDDGWGDEFDACNDARDNVCEEYDDGCDDACDDGDDVDDGWKTCDNICDDSNDRSGCGERR